MSLLGFDGFSAYAFLDDLENSSNWVRETQSGNAALVSDGGQHERGGLRVGGQNRNEEEWYFDLGPTITESTIGFWFKYEAFDTLEDIEDLFLSWRSNTTYRGSMRIKEDGSITFRRSSNSTEYFDSADASETATGTPLFLFPGSEYKIEIKSTHVNLSGNLEIRVNGVLWFILEGGIDWDATVNRIYFQTGSVGSGVQYQISDFWVIEGDGIAPDGFLGASFEVEVLVPTSESGTESDFTPESGTDNHLMVDDGNPHDADATWIESAINGDIDRCLTTGTLVGLRALGVNVVSVARHLGSADSYRNTIFENATAANGGTEALTDKFLPYHALFTVNPDTTEEWIPADIEACEFGVENMA
jgi:hypothetical protein